ncbi:MAG TPA: hypothetical protein VNF07_05990 [Acidimicrobiales bacterium]|nr:hypothetical protein [Acidimicrobiales bacterium]
MAFGQQSGPPAPPRVVAELLERVQEAGYADFREARHPLGLNQRQAAGRFTRDEASALLEQLQALEDDAPPTAAPPPRRGSAAQELLAMVSDKQLAAELERRGWTLIAP